MRDHNFLRGNHKKQKWSYMELYGAFSLFHSQMSNIMILHKTHKKQQFRVRVADLTITIVHILQHFGDRSKLAATRPDPGR